MGQFDNTTLQDYEAQSQNPAAPVGLRQDAQDMASGQFKDTRLGATIEQQGYVPVSQSWFSGANSDGTNNGWDTTFINDFITKQNQAGNEGKLNTYFEQPDATGVVTWDHDSTDGKTHYTFGDVYQDGKKVANLYDKNDAGFDRDTANLMMSKLILSKDDRQHIFSASDATERLDREVQGKREKNNVDIPQSQQAAQFQKGVTARAAGFQEGIVDEAIIGSTAAGGAALGAGVGAAFFGIGALPGALIGGAIGGTVGLVGGALNQDALTEQAARAYEITSLSSEEFGTRAGIATGVTQWSGFAGKTISPFSNLTQGAIDATYGTVGDNVSEFYKVDAEGRSVVPKWVKVTDVIASVGDAAIQFSNPIGAGLYTAQMGFTIGGEVGEITLTGGETFDYSRGGFDNVFTDDNGQFSPLRAAAGIGKIGIDVVQLGMARGLMGKADSAIQATAAGGTVYGTGRLAARLPAWLGGRTAAEKAALANGGSLGEAAGKRFVLDESGRAVSSRKTLSLLAPSEQLQYLSARVRATRATAEAQGAFTTDDFYRAARAMATGEKRWTTALVNGMGEGYEEVAQAVLEPYSHEQSFTFEDLATAGLYGFAMGVGMNIGTGINMPSMDKTMFGQAQIAQLMRDGEITLTETEWKGYTEVEKRTAAALSDIEMRTAQAAFKQASHEQRAEMVAGAAGLNKINDAIAGRFAAEMRRITDLTDQAFVITQLEDAGEVDAQGNLTPSSMPSDAVGSSVLQLAHSFNNRLRGVEIQLGALERDLEQVVKDLIAAPADEALLARQQTLTRQVEQVKAMVAMGEILYGEIEARAKRIMGPNRTEASVYAEVQALNALLRDAFNLKLPSFTDTKGQKFTLTQDQKMALARVTSRVVGRDPFDQSGSVQVLVPQASVALTWNNSDNVLQISHALLPALRGDYDGDKIRGLEQLLLDENEFISARSGAHFIGAGASVNVKAPKYEQWVVENLGDSLQGRYSEALENFATGTLTQIGVALRSRYTGVVDQDVLDEVLADFFGQMRAGVGDARKTLLDGLAGKAGGEITAFARDNLSNEWLWIDQMMRASMQAFQEGFAEHRPDIGEAPNTELVAPHKGSRKVRERRATEAATEGTTMGLELAGDTMFRKFQKLHYLVIKGAVMSSDTRQRREALDELAALYAALSSGITQSELDNVRAKDDITAWAYVQLERLAREVVKDRQGVSMGTAMTVVANLAVADIKIDADGNQVPGKTITLAQLLLKRSVERDQRKNHQILDISPELQMKHQKLLAMTRPSKGSQGVEDSRPVNAQRAAAEILGSQQIYTLLGKNSLVFGPHLTVEQFIRAYVSMSTDARREIDLKLKGEAAYLGRKKKKDLPYGLTEVMEGEVSAYRALVDTIIAVGHNRITMDEDGTLHGEYAKTSNDTSKDYRKSWETLTSALEEFKRLSPGTTGETDAQAAQRMMESRPQEAAKLMALIPNVAAAAVFRIQGNEVFIANWFYEMFEADDAKHAEMIYWRGLLLAWWNAKGIPTDEELDDGEMARSFDSLTRRMHRVMYALHPNNTHDGGLALDRFIIKLEQATDLEEFMKWVNTTPGVRSPKEAPLVPWVDDVSEFDQDKARGGWTAQLAGSELREAMRSLKQAARGLVNDLASEATATDADIATIAAIRRVIKRDAGDTTVTLADGDRETHDKMVAVLKAAGERYTGLGPQAMLFQIVGAVRGYNPDSSAKGVVPDNVDNAGQFEAQRDAAGYVTNYERIQSAVTSYSIDDVSAHMEMLAKDDTRTMDDHGRQVLANTIEVGQAMDLFADPKTRAGIRAVLFPQVMERDFDGVLRPKLLVGKSLASLLDGSSHDEMFPKNDRLSPDAALRYVSAVEAEARRYGGHFSIQRLANDLVIARISAADHKLSTAELEKMARDALYDIATALQATGSVAATLTPTGDDPLASLRVEAKAAQRRVRFHQKLGLDQPLTRDIVEGYAETWIQDLEKQGEEDIQQALDTMTPEGAAEKKLQIDAATAKAREQIEFLINDDFVGNVVSMFTLPSDPNLAADARTKLVAYLTSKLTVIERGSSAMLLMSKLTTQLLDPSRDGQPELKPAEWTQLQNLAIGLYLDDVASTTAANVSVPPFPDAKHKDDQRYYDPSFSYLVDAVLDINHPLVKAAAALHIRAGRGGPDIATNTDIINVLKQGMLKEFSFGDWTSDIPRNSIEANMRLDAASSAAAISMAGNSPKRQAAISAATRRTYDIPTDDMFSTTTLGFNDFGRDAFDDVEVVLPVVGSVNRPLTQLNNRFARSVLMSYTDRDGKPQTMELLTGPDSVRDLGRPFVGSDLAANSGLQSIHLSRVERAMEAAARRNNFDASSATVKISFLHPDSQPPEWHNNLFFEGVSFKLDADRSASLNETLWFVDGGINPLSQASALDANKLGQAALQVIPAPTRAQVQALEDLWSIDFSAMLRGKTKILMQTNLTAGAKQLEDDPEAGRLDEEAFNSVYKNMKMRHFIIGHDDTTGDRIVLTAEQVIAHQAAGTMPAMGDAKLWVPSDSVLVTMLGEQGTQGVDRLRSTDLEFDPMRIPTYRGITDQMLSDFEAGFDGDTVDIFDTKVVNRAKLSQFQLRQFLSDSDRSAYDARILYRRSLLSAGEEARSQLKISDTGWDPKENMAKALKAAAEMLQAENIAFDWSGFGLPIGPRSPSTTRLAQMVLHDVKAMLSNDGRRTGWIYREGQQYSTVQGLLSEENLNSEGKPGMSVLPGDLVVVELDSFKGDRERARKRIAWLQGRGAIIVLGAGNGEGNLRAELADYLAGSGYTKVLGSAHVYQPEENTRRFQNQRARVSSLTEMRGVSKRSMIMGLMVPDLGIYESSVWINPDDERLGSIAVVLDLLPTNYLGGFNVPAGNASVDAVRAHLMGLNNSEGRGLLEDMAGAKTKAEKAELKRALDVLFQRLTDNPRSMLPIPGSQFGTGDIIPLVDGQGRILLYRHGMKAPKRRGDAKRDGVEEMAARTLDGTNAMNVAIYSGKTEPLSTDHTGEVIRFKPRSGYGLQVEMALPLQLFGDKFQLEWNGLKLLGTPMPKSIVLPDHGLFANGWGINAIYSAHDVASKESFEGIANNHRTLFMGLGIDFMPDMMKFFGTNEAGVREILQGISRRDSISVEAAHELITAQGVANSLMDRLTQDGAQGWESRLSDDTVEAQIARAMVIYLLTPGAEYTDVIASGGLNDDTYPDGKSTLMPRLFTQAFDLAPFGSVLRLEMNDRFNKQLYNPHNDGTGYRLHENFVLEVRNADPKKNLRGFLQFAEAHSSGDNPIKNGMSFDNTEKGAASAHSAAILAQAVGGRTLTAYDISKSRLFAKGEGIERDFVDGGMWRMLTSIPAEDKSALLSWRLPTPGEALRRTRAREQMVLFRQGLNPSKDNGWTKEQEREYAEAAKDIVQWLGLKASQSGLVDFWVRQMLGQPAGSGDRSTYQEVTGTGALDAAEAIRWNVEHGYLPTNGAAVPMFHVNDLQLLFRINSTRNMNPWSPREAMSPNSPVAGTGSWKAWVGISLGTALLNDELFDPVYLLALDGFMHTYQNATTTLIDLPVSMDSLVTAQLLDPENNRLIASIEGNTDLLAADPILLDIQRASVDELVGGRSTAGKFEGRFAPGSERGRRMAELRKWRKEHNVPIPVDQTMKNFRKNGQRFADNSTNANALSRMLINLRVGMALLNPALYLSMGPEQWIRGTLDRAANIITGTSTAGATGQALAKVGWSRFTPDQIRKLSTLYETLGDRNDFKAMVYRDLMFLRPGVAGHGRIEGWLESYAKAGARAQDPTWGMSAKTLARRYVEAAMMSIEAMPTVNVLTTDQLVAALTTDPEYLKKNLPTVHREASNAIAQLRSLKATPLSLALRGIYEPMSSSTNSMTNFLGNVVLKLPLLFSGYAMNVATTITGMQGASDMYAAFKHGKAKGPHSLFGRIQAVLAGRKYSPEDDALYDFDSVLEGIDLSRSFIRGGLTHTGLFAFGLLASGLGLSGEDDESKKRRRMSKLQGAGYVYDPRLLQNDFRNADAMFLDWLPGNLGNYFKVTDQAGGSNDMAQMNWVLKQFLSPIIGFEKFYETGDFRNVTWGFQDALGAFPLINTLMWDDAVQTAHELAAAADKEGELGGPANLTNAAWFLTNGVGVYERMLFENAFVNQLYVSLDPYDRDPYALPLRDSDGDLQTDIEGNARKNDIALEPYIDPITGEVKEGYQGRSTESGTLHALSENRATMAFIAQMFTGLGPGESDFWRYSMPEKTRQFTLPEQSEDDAKLLIRAAAEGAGGQQNLTLEEITSILKNRYAKAKNWDAYNNIANEAAQLYAQHRQEAAVMSVLDKDGREHLTEEGAKGVMWGLYKGSVKLGDSSLAGIYILPEVREKIQKEWTEALVQEGIDLGLDQSKAVARMNRLWYGPQTDPSIQGLGDLLWSKDIPFSDKVVYKQLNTTYVIGPDGKPWATGATRGGLMQALGVPGVGWAKRYYVSEQSATGTDQVLNTTDFVNKINTGLRALELVDDSANVPTDVEIGKSIEAAIKAAAAKSYTPTTPYASNSGSGGGGFGGYSGGGSGGFFSRMYALPGGTSPYGNTIPFINTSNPNIRRANIRRERVWSERGRLKQWQ